MNSRDYFQNMPSYGSRSIYEYLVFNNAILPDWLTSNFDDLPRINKNLGEHDGHLAKADFQTKSILNIGEELYFIIENLKGQWNVEWFADHGGLYYIFELPEDAGIFELLIK